MKEGTNNKEVTFDEVMKMAGYYLASKRSGIKNGKLFAEVQKRSIQMIGATNNISFLEDIEPYLITNPNVIDEVDMSFVEGVSETYKETLKQSLYHTKEQVNTLGQLNSKDTLIQSQSRKVA